MIITNSNSLHLPVKSGIAQMCVTSPPYYGLRDYGTATWAGGNDGCDHLMNKLSSDKSTLHEAPEKKKMEAGIPYKDTCAKCDATRIDSQIGLEETPEQYVDKLVQVFREVKRVLKKDGTLWLNLGDSYAANRGYQVTDNKHVDVGNTRGMKAADCGVKPKDLIGIPWMVAFALRADGWYLRQDIIWAKPNPMPESVRDRCTKSHEYIFLLSKSQNYFYDYDAVLEAATGYDGRKDTTFKGSKKDYTNVMPNSNPNTLTNHGEHERWKYKDDQPVRNKRSVWTVTTKPYKGAHFATFPPALIEPCILAGSAKGDLVIDPFNGSGTTGQVALQNGRNYYGSELSKEYINLSKERLKLVQVKMI